MAAVGGMVLFEFEIVGHRRNDAEKRGPHRFRSGAVVLVFTEGDGVRILPGIGIKNRKIPLNKDAPIIIAPLINNVCKISSGFLFLLFSVS